MICEHPTGSPRNGLQTVIAVTLALVATAAVTRGEQDTASLEQLPPAVRPLASALLAEGDQGRRALLIDEIAEREPSASVPFLIALLPRETSSAVRMAIVNGIGHSGSLDVEAQLRTIASVERDLTSWQSRALG